MTPDQEQEIEFPALNDRRFPIGQAAGRLAPYLRAIVEKINPERIILFGSYAYGEPTEHSDFDLLIVRKDIPSSKESNMEVRYAIRDVNASPASFTFLSQTPQGLEDKLNSGSFIYREIISRGLQIYAAKENQ
jgi:hypothetical protein